MDTLADHIAAIAAARRYRSPVANSIARQRPNLPAVKAFERDAALAASGPQGNAQDQQSAAYAPQPEGRYIGSDIAEASGLPSLVRGGLQLNRAARAGPMSDRPEDQPGGAIPDLAMGGLGALGMIGGGSAAMARELPARRAPMVETVDARPALPDLPPATLNVRAYRGLSQAFDPTQARTNSGVKWFAGEPETANTYAREEGGNVEPANLALSNPLRIDVGGRGYGEVPLSAIADPHIRARLGSAETASSDLVSRAVQADGRYDGVVFNNMDDPLNAANPGAARPGTVYGLFSERRASPSFGTQDAARPAASAPDAGGGGGERQGLWTRLGDHIEGVRNQMRGGPRPYRSSEDARAYGGPTMQVLRSPDMGAFMAGAERNRYVDLGGDYRAYLRKSERTLDGERVRTLDLANVQRNDIPDNMQDLPSDQLRGRQRGDFFTVMTKLEHEARQSGASAVYVESIHNRFLPRILRDYGYTIDNSVEPPSAYKFLDDRPSPETASAAPVAQRPLTERERVIQELRNRPGGIWGGEIETPQTPDGGASAGGRSGTEMDRLLHDPQARQQHAEAATIHQTQMGGHPLTMYDFKDSPALTNVRFQPLPDGRTYTVAMSARGAEAHSPMSTKARVFADTISAIEHHAAQNNATERGLSYLFTGESDAHTRLFRGIAERATWPPGAVIHDTPAGFEVSFAPQREPFTGELPFNTFAHQPKYNPNLGQEGRLSLSETINNRARQIAQGRTGTTANAPTQGTAEPITQLFHSTTARGPIQRFTPSSDGAMGPGVYFEDSGAVRKTGGAYAAYPASGENAPTVYPAQISGRITDIDRPTKAEIADARASGAVGVRNTENGHVVIFPEHADRIQSRISQAPPNGSALPPLGAAAIAGLSELPRRRTQRQTERYKAPQGAFFMGAQ